MASIAKDASMIFLYLMAQFYRRKSRSTNGGDDANFFDLGGDGTKTVTLGDVYNQSPCERSSVRSKQTNHVGDRIVMSPTEAILVTSPWPK